MYIQARNKYINTSNYKLSHNLQDNDPVQAIAVSLDNLGHLLHHEVDGLVLLEGQSGEVDLQTAVHCTAVWSKVFWQLQPES